MGACTSSSRGQSNQGKNQKSSKVAAVPSSPATKTDVQHQAAKGEFGHSEMQEKRIFQWRIDGFSSLLAKSKGWTSSSYFEIEGLKWYLQLKLNDRKNGDEKEYVSLVLKLSRTSLEPNIVVDASFKFLIYDQAYGKHIEHESNHHFQTDSNCAEVLCMIPLEALKKPTSGFVVGDSCVFGVELIKVTHAAKVLSVEKTVSRELYTWEIDDFLALNKRCYSPEFEIGGHKWYISMHPYGVDNSCEFISLYLNLSKPYVACCEVLVEVSLSVKDQKSVHHKKLAGQCRFSAHEKEGDGWGWSKFMSLEEFRGSSSPYLVKGRCCIEADVAIIGSHKMA